MDILKYLRANHEGWSEPDIVWVQVSAARAKEAADEIERLREYEQLVKFISSDYIELSHEKVAWQRDDWRKRCRALQQKGTE